MLRQLITLSITAAIFQHEGTVLVLHAISTAETGSICILSQAL